MLRRTILILTLVALALGKDKCYALALEGGGDKGAYQAGAVYTLAHELPEGQAEWDVITGISVGAINGAYLALFEEGDEKAATKDMLDLWRGLTREEVVVDWPNGGIARGILFKKGIYDDTPLKEYLDEKL